MKAIKTQGNFMVYGPQGERRAAFALESDKRLFDTALGLVPVLQLVKEDIEGFLSGEWDGNSDGWHCTLAGINAVLALPDVEAAQPTPAPADPPGDGVHVCLVCGLETPATGDDFYYPASPACGHYARSGHPNTEYRPPR